jgi:lipopolysaccharide/colanic/teichoic acid biosynthesis glycosyltransferase
MRRHRELFIEHDSTNGETFWSRLDAALDEGYEVWLRSPLLERLMTAVGKKKYGRKWLVIRPRVKENKPLIIIRLRDVTLSGLALVLLSPIMLLVSLLIKITSPGPLFFSTAVVGKYRKPFIWYKFRSMYVVPSNQDIEQRRARFEDFVRQKNDSGTGTQPNKVIDERRITWVGRYIRKFSIDELPQLWNVLRGQMSLVGPRPCLPYEAEFYTGWRGRRFEVQPGLTGVWQVFGRGRTGFDGTIAMDLYYIYCRSFLFDLYLILKTICVVFTGSGSK